MKLLKKPYIYIFLVGSSILLIRYLFSATESEWFYQMYGYYGQTFIEPLEIVALTLCILAAWLFFFRESVQREWWRIARWFGVVVVLILGFSLTIPYQGGGFISFPGVREIIVLWSVLISVFTIVFTLAKK